MSRQQASGSTLFFLLLAFLSAAAEDNNWLPVNMRLWQLFFLALAAAGAMLTAVRFYTSGRYGRVQSAAIALIAITGMIHLFLGIRGDWLLLANGLGFYVLLCAAYFPIAALAPYRRPIIGLLLIYTLATIVGYFVSHAPVAFDVVGLASKAVELALVAVLIVEWRQRYRVFAPSG